MNKPQIRKSFRSMQYSLIAVSCLVISLLPSAAQEIDDSTGLKIDDGWQQVSQTCTFCHAALMITQNSGTREVWRSRIEWMQKTQGMEQLSVPIEDEILSYLAENYGPKESTRRALLAADFLPVNPYPTND